MFLVEKNKMDVIRAIIKYCINHKIVGCFDFRENKKHIEKSNETFVLIVIEENKGIWFNDKSLEYYANGKIVKKEEIEKILNL